MTLKYSLIEEQEQQFWRLIAADLSAKLELPKDHTKWQFSHRKKIDAAMRTTLHELCKENSMIANLCNCENHKDLISGQQSFLSTINTYFRNELKTKTHHYNKHRFAFFLTLKSANEYIEDNDILAISEATPPASPQPLGIVAPAELKDKVLEEYLRPLINRFEFYAYRVQRELDRRSGQESIQQFRKDFTEMHQKILKHFNEKKDIQTGIDMYLEIYQLASTTFFQKDDNGEESMLNEFGGFGFYLRDESVSGKLKKYLAYSNLFAEQVEAFRQLTHKTEQDYQAFLQELLRQYR